MENKILTPDQRLEKTTLVLMANNKQLDSREAAKLAEILVKKDRTAEDYSKIGKQSNSHYSKLAQLEIEALRTIKN